MDDSKIKYEGKYYHFRSVDTEWIDDMDEEYINRYVYDKNRKRYTAVFAINKSYLDAVKILKSVQYDRKTHTFNEKLITPAVESAVCQWIQEHDPEVHLPASPNAFYADEYLYYIAERHDIRQALKGFYDDIYDKQSNLLYIC